MIKTTPVIRPVEKWVMRFLLCFAGIALAIPTPAARPNIVFFITDDHGLLDSSVYGSKDVSTPNMRKLADRGVTFTNAFVASPSCAPSRAALITGLMPARNGAEANHSRPRPEIRKWPAYFQELGYEVVAFGKVTHYQHTADYGFDHFAHDRFHDQAAIPAAIKFLETHDPNATRPLCLMVGSNWPHVPWPKEFSTHDPETLTLPAGSIDTSKTREWRAQYLAAVDKADEDFGRIYETAQSKLGKDAITLFSSDHGAQWPFGKWNLYDAGIRVPLIVEWSGVVKRGTKSDATVSWIDILPTLLEAAGGQPPPDIDGQSFLPVLRGEKTSHRDRIFTTHTGDERWNIYPMRSVRTAEWKYIMNLHPEFAFTTHIDLPGELGQRDFWSTWESAAKTDKFAAAIVNGYHQRPADELYELTADPHEQHNLASHPNQEMRIEEMRSELRTWMRSQDDKTTVPAKPRLLSDPSSYGPGAAALGTSVSKIKGR
ncbi:MAG: sulfatase family protein [Candidatus Sumerlaeaceae bacterium]